MNSSAVEYQCTPQKMRSTDFAQAPTQCSTAIKAPEPFSPHKSLGLFKKQISKGLKGSLCFKKLLDSKKLSQTMAKTTNQSELGVVCSICGQKFAKSQSLGGHMSKKHAGKSDAYRLKQEKRDLNEDDRKMRKQAKEYFAMKTNKDPAAFRSKITQIKKIFIALDSYPTPQEEKELNLTLDAIVSLSK